jgi:hypothetical protein
MAIEPFKTKKEKNKFLKFPIFLSILGFFSVRHYREYQWEYGSDLMGYFYMFFHFAPAIIAVGLWYIYFTATVGEENEDEIFKKPLRKKDK